MDHVPKAVRSRIMASVRSRGNTTTEMRLGKLLWAAGIRGYRKHWHILGKPDFAWPKRKLAVFVDGCFWHGCRCKRLPKSNKKFWRDKIDTNKCRDLRITRMLRRDGWTVIRVKECAVAKQSTVTRIRLALSYARKALA